MSTRLPTRAGPRHGPVNSTWPLVGRAGTLRDVVAAADGGRWAGFVLVGATGVGRTRLARAALAAVCPPGSSRVPFWAMAGRATASVPLGALGPVLGDLGVAGDGRGGAATARLLRAARERLLDLAGGSRPVIAVDDAHVLDLTSAVLLGQLAAAGEAFVLVTAPRGVPVPSPVFALWKEGLAARADIGPLGRAQSDRLVVHALCDDGPPGSVVDGGTLARLWRLSGGNPLLLRELVDGGRDAGTLRRVGAVWRWAGPFPLTPRLTELVDAQTGDLRAAERDLLRLVAFGQPLDSEIATALVDRDVLASAERSGLVRSTRNGSRIDLHVSRPLHAEVLRGRTTPLQEREIYRRLSDAAESIAADGGAGPTALDRWRMVSWRVARGLSADPEELLGAVEDVTQDDPDLAARLLRAAAEQDAGPEIRLRLACTMIRFGDHERAETVLADLDREPVTGARVWPQRADVTLVRAHNLYWGLRAFDRLHAVLADGSAPPPIPPTDGTREYPAGTALRAFRALIDGRAADATDTLAPAAAEPDAGLPVLAVAAAAAARAGRYAAAVEFAGRSGLVRTADIAADAATGSRIDVAEDDGAGGWLRVETLAAWWYALLQTGDLAGADRIARACLAGARAHGSDGYTAVFSTWTGITAGRCGRLVTASRRLLRAAAGVQAARFPFTVPLVAELAMAAAATGRVDRAEQVLAEGGRVPADPLLTGWTHAPRVLIAGARGRTTYAEELALAAAVETGEAHGHRVQALHTAVRLGITGEVTTRLVELTDGADGPLERAYGAHAAALARRDGPELVRVADLFAGLGADLLAAETAAQAAHAHRTAGATGAATAAAARAREWAERCEGARTPALALLAGTTSLTPRETEIASLAADGMTSKAIAGELVVSVRTVDNVLRSVYAKLGVAGRGDLVRVAGLRRSS